MKWIKFDIFTSVYLDSLSNIFTSVYLDSLSDSFTWVYQAGLSGGFISVHFDKIVFLLSLLMCI